MLMIFVMLRRTRALILFGLICTVCSSVAFADDDADEIAAAAKQLQQRLERWTHGDLPANVMLRIRTDASSVGREPPEELKEIWEFTRGKVHRVEWRPANDESQRFERVETRDMDTSGLIRQMLRAGIVSVEFQQGTGDPLQFSGTNFDIGHRCIQLHSGEETLVNTCESCFFAGYAKSDARRFGRLYAKLASQARAAFARPVGSRNHSVPANEGS